jgi:hypothetical protein
MITDVLAEHVAAIFWLPVVLLSLVTDLDATDRGLCIQTAMECCNLDVSSNISKYQENVTYEGQGMLQQ